MRFYVQTDFETLRVNVTKLMLPLLMHCQVFYPVNQHEYLPGQLLLTVKYLEIILIHTAWGKHGQYIFFFLLDCKKLTTLLPQRRILKKAFKPFIRKLYSLITT